MGTIERSVEVAVPVRTAYDQWTQFESFPHFMEDVERIEQLTDTTVRWHVNVAGADRSWDAEITEQKPDERIAWTAQGDTKHAGVVTFHRLDDSRTKVMLQMDVEPSDWIEKVGDALGVMERNVERDLENFKGFIEERASRPAPGGARSIRTRPADTWTPMPTAPSRRHRRVQDGGPVSSNDDRLIGGRYELVSRIARGGGGTVWRAEDTVLGRTVAVKAVEVPDELTPDERHRARTRVLQEARAAARLDHPAAVVVHDVLDDDDRLHLVMELVEVPTLRQRVQRDGPLPESEAAEIGLGLTDVLAVAHERGIVHRDVKPSNIFVYPDGGVKLADFGIAALTGEASLTRTGTALGSPSYLAPEQARGEQASPAADVWGLGASLYYAVEGEPPFERGNAIATVNAVVHEPARAFQRADELRPLLGSLLSKEPSDRPSLPETEQASRPSRLPLPPLRLRPHPRPPSVWRRSTPLPRGPTRHRHRTRSSCPHPRSPSRREQRTTRRMRLAGGGRWSRSARSRRWCSSSSARWWSSTGRVTSTTA
jgi:serine/threonine protein kinase